MTDNPNVGFADYRRAAVLTMHQRRGNNTGVSAIIDETNAANRAAQLLLAVLGLHRRLIGRLRTEEGISLLADYVHGMATLEATEPPGTDITRAARLVELHVQDDNEGIGREMVAANAEGRATDAFKQLMGLYEVALPELTSEAGIAWIEAQIDALRTEEFRPDDDGGDR
jgi:hypothetical protein